MKKICEMLRKKDVGAIGIGAMIVFIAMVLVAGIAASVLIQTSTKLESQAMATGQETVGEVATGIAVFDIEGYADVGSSADITKVGITVRPRAGSADVDLLNTFIEISDTTNKIVLRYVDATSYNWWDHDSEGLDNIFGFSVFPAAADDYGILVLEDADGSCSEATPVINRGDKVILTIDLSQCFSGGWAERTDIWGMIVPEIGSSGVLSFRTPAAYNDYIMDLY